MPRKAFNAGSQKSLLSTHVGGGGGGVGVGLRLGQDGLASQGSAVVVVELTSSRRLYSVTVCKTTSRKGRSKPKTIQMSIILK